MLTCGIFDIAEVRLTATCNEPLYLIPFGDVHHDSPEFSQSVWEQFLERCEYLIKRFPVAFLPMGDYLDSYSTSERSVLLRGKKDSLHSSTLDRMEKEGMERTAKFVKDIEFMRGRCLGLISGNHFIQFKGVTSDHLIAKELACQFLGVAGFIRLTLYLESKDTTLSMDIYAHHGKGSGARTPGGKMNAVAYQSEFIDADIICMGHDHSRGVLPLPPMLHLSRGHNQKSIQVKHRQRFIGRTGSFLKAYSPGEESYNVDAARAPASLGWIEFEITPKLYSPTLPNRKRQSQYSIDIRGIS